jgi:hypothetical protein
MGWGECLLEIIGRRIDDWAESKLNAVIAVVHLMRAITSL